MERIAIVGAGVMGQGIAEVFAAARVWKSVWEERSL
jgi:3-hydroxyacyl-CoA dehydrogenase